MTDSFLASSVALVFGRPGSGKTSFAFRYLVNRATVQDCNPCPAVCTFIFDWKLEASQRLGIAPCGTLAQCEAAIQSRWVLFNPSVMFQAEEGKEPADFRALRWFLAWVFEVSKRGPGRKVLFVDELAQFIDNRNDRIPPELETVLRQHRTLNLELLISTQFPSDYARVIRGSVTEWICFSTDEEDDLKKVRQYFRNVDKVRNFPRGQFLAYNRDSGAEMAGKLF